MASPSDERTSRAEEVLAALLVSVARNQCSDLHLRPGSPAFARVDGRLSRANTPPLEAEVIERIIECTSGRPIHTWGEGEFEYSFDREGLGRYRGHAFRVSRGWALALRTIPLKVPDFATLRLPPVVKTFAQLEAGLVLITGPTNSGKSTTVASLLEYMTQNDVLHVVTIEDPVEYLLAPEPSCVSQRELGRDTTTWQDALRAVVREDPDVVFIGEIRDRETLDTALQVAETGHTVFSTFHTPTALQTILRMIALYEPAAQETARARLADALRGVLCQRLLPKRGSRGRVLSTEVLVGSYSIQEAIRDPAKTRSIPAVIERSSDQQMCLMDESLRRLVRANLVEVDVARRFATSPNDFLRSLALAG